MNEKTIPEDLVEFFAWFWGWFEPTMEWFAAVAPGLALLGAVFAYFNRRKADRDDQARLQRAEIYKRYLEEISGLDPTGRGFLGHAVRSSHQLVQLVAPNAVAEASTQLVQWHSVTFFAYANDSDRGEALPPMELYNLSKQHHDHLENLIIAMRQDLLQGTSINADLSPFKVADKKLIEQEKN